MTALRLQVLGDLEVIRGGAVLDLPPSRKTRGLLAYLALNERPMRREQLCELLWEIPDDPRGSLRWSLSKIRKLVDEDDQPRIIADRSTVSFDTSSVDIDVLDLHRAAEENPRLRIPIVCMPASINNDLPGSELSIGVRSSRGTRQESPSVSRPR